MSNFKIGGLPHVPKGGASSPASRPQLEIPGGRGRGRERPVQQVRSLTPENKPEKRSKTPEGKLSVLIRDALREGMKPV